MWAETWPRLSFHPRGKGSVLCSQIKWIPVFQAATRFSVYPAPHSSLSAGH